MCVYMYGEQEHLREWNEHEFLYTPREYNENLSLSLSRSELTSWPMLLHARPVPYTLPSSRNCTEAVLYSTYRCCHAGARVIGGKVLAGRLYGNGRESLASLVESRFAICESNSCGRGYMYIVRHHVCGLSREVKSERERRVYVYFACLIKDFN